nr:copia protein [Tanacetum cinerariifolium]
MGDERLGTVPAMKSDEFIKSSVENLVSISSEFEGILDNLCDIPFHDNSPPLDVLKYQFEDFFDSNDESTSIDDDSFSVDNIEYVEASPPHSELVSSEVMEIVNPEVGGIDDDILLTIKDDILHEKLLNVNLLIANIEALKDNPTPSSDFMTNSGSTTTRSDISLLKYKAFYNDHVKEISSGSTTTHSDSSLYDSFLFDLSINPFPPADRSDFYEFADKLTHIISSPEYDFFCFKIEPNSGDFTMDVVEDTFQTREPRYSRNLKTHTEGFCPPVFISSASFRESLRFRAIVDDKQKFRCAYGSLEVLIYKHIVGLELIRLVLSLHSAGIEDTTRVGNFRVLTLDKSLNPLKSRFPVRKKQSDIIGTPMDIKDKLDLDQIGTPIDATKYGSMIDALMYLTSIKPDIVHATCVCDRYQAHPTEKHLKEVKRIFHADYAGCKDTFKSTSGGAQFLGEKLVSWSSKKQDCTSLSTAKSEYVSLSACFAQVLWMRTQLTDYGYHFDKILIYCESKSAIAISYNPVQHSRTKHIAVRYHFIKEHVEKGTIELYFVKTDYQLADIFTKALPVDRFNYLVCLLGMRSLCPQELDRLAKLQ